MIQTFVFGTPHGFNYFEQDKYPQYDAYFKSFYISTRKGSRMMINRNHKGDTIYTFLRYDLIEVHSRPNSFFGMSIILGDYQYSDDPKNVFQFFEYLFESVCKRGKIFHYTDSGNIQYSIEKFSDAAAEIEWLKRNLPKIFSKDANANILAYDGSFELGNTGQIACLSDQESNECILNVLKKYHWVCISSEFEKTQESSQGKSVSPEIELSYTEIDSKYNDINEKLVQFAYGNKEKSAAIIENANSEVQDITSNIIRFINNLEDSDEKDSFIKLLDKYKFLDSIISTALKDIPPKAHEQPAPTKKNNDDNPPQNKQPKNPSNVSGRLIELNKIFTPKLYALLLIIALGCWFFFGGQNEDELTNNGIVEIEGSKPLDEQFKESTFKQYLDNNEFDSALEYIKKYHIDSPDYYSLIKQGVAEEVMNIIEVSPVEQVNSNVTEYFIRHRSYIDNDLIEETYWKSFAKDYVILARISTTNTLSEKNYEECCEILERYSNNKIISDLARSIIAKYKASSTLNASEIEASQTSQKRSVIITNLDNKNNKLSTDTTNKDKIYDFEVGTFVTIKPTFKEKIKFNNNNNFDHNPTNNLLKIELKDRGANTYTIGDIKITINATYKEL